MLNNYSLTITPRSFDGLSNNSKLESLDSIVILQLTSSHSTLTTCRLLSENIDLSRNSINIKQIYILKNGMATTVISVICNPKKYQ